VLSAASDLRQAIKAVRLHRPRGETPGGAAVLIQSDNAAPGGGGPGGGGPGGGIGAPGSGSGGGGGGGGCGLGSGLGMLAAALGAALGRRSRRADVHHP
jgi:hypothetical protein